MADSPIPFTVRVIDGTITVGDTSRATIVVQTPTIPVVVVGGPPGASAPDTFFDLSDTALDALGGPNAGDLVQFDGSNWVNILASSVGVTSHLALTDIGVNTHAAIDTHIADGSIHFTEASIDHTAIMNIGVNSHATIDLHIADTDIHFSDAPSDAQTYARRDAAWVEIQTGGALISGVWRFETSTATAPSSGRFRQDNVAYASVVEIFIADTTRPGFDATNILSALSVGDRLYIQNENDASEWVIWDVDGAVTDEGTWFRIPVNLVNNGSTITNNRDCLIAVLFGGGVGGLSHFDLTDIGVNTHATIDTHIADGTIHFTLEAVDDQVAGLLQDVEGLTFDYDDGANTLTPVLDGLLSSYLSMSKSSFVSSDFTGTVSLLHEQPFRAIGGSGGTVVATTTDLADHPGIWCIDTGAADVNGRVFVLTSTNLGSWQFGTGNEIRATSWVFGGPAISTALQRYTIRSGFSNITPPNAINNAVTFEYSDDQNGGRWQAITHDGTETTTDTGVTFAVSTWYKLEIVINAAGTSVEFFIDDVSVATNTTNIPTGTGFFHFHSDQIIKTIGLGSRTLYIDATAIYTEVTR